MPRVPDGRAGMWAARQSCDQILEGWFCSLLGGFGGGKLYILGVAGYNTPIWDVLALQGERKEVGEHLCGDRLLFFSKLGKRCQVGCLLTV